MAERPKGYGMTAELQDKKAAKRDPALERDVQSWIEECLSIQFDPSLTYEENLKNGILLCKLVNKVGTSPIKINESNMAFKQMENIGKFLHAAEGLGVAKTDLFQTVDLYEYQNIPAVTTGIIAFGRKCRGRFNLPLLGPAESTTESGEFTEEQLRSGERVIGLQLGSNEFGNSPYGLHFGARQ